MKELPKVFLSKSTLQSSHCPIENKTSGKPLSDHSYALSSNHYASPVVSGKAI